jgi:predicted DNA-binding antitoxin AbrB/MazE fold protein
MTILTVEGVVENGMIKLAETVKLPEHAKVYVIVPGIEYDSADSRKAWVVSPRLAVREQIADFRMDVSEDSDDASIQ